MRKTTTSQDHTVVMFDSMADMMEHTDTKAFRRADREFVGMDIRSWDEVQHKSTDVWEEGLDTINEFVKRLMDADLPEPVDHRRKVSFNMDDGDEVDLDRLRSGQDYFRKSERETTQGPQEVTVITDITTVGSRDPEDVFWRGAAALALTQLLEEKGYRVELWVCRASDLVDRGTVVTAIKLKDCGDPLDMATLAVNVSGWYYRSAIFTMARTLRNQMRPGCDNEFGTIKTPNAIDLDEMSRDENRIYSSGVFSFNGALEMIRAELESLIERTS